jgi:alcohol dehydrogenase
VEIAGAVLRNVGAQRPYIDSEPLSIEKLDLAAPRSTELLIELQAASICHSDLSVIDGNRPRPLPMLLGHEASGRVVAIGSSIDDITVDQRVILTFLPRCGECAHCHTNGALPCSAGSAANGSGTLFAGGTRLKDSTSPVLHHLGVSAFATHAVVDRRSVVPVDADVPPDVAAVLGCAVLTGGGALLNNGHITADDTVTIVGLGGVGMAALLTAAAVGCREIVAIDSQPEKLSIAATLGATSTYTPDAAVSAGVRTRVVLEAVGHAKAFETALALVSAGGLLITVGLAAPTAHAEIAPGRITAEAITIVGSYMGASVPERDIPIFVDLWRSGRLQVEKLISGHIPLHEINMAMDRLADSSALRQVIVFNGEYA